MTNYVVGTAGSPPRMIVVSAAAAQLQVKSGEVCFALDPQAPAAPHTINSEGTALIASGPSLADLQKLRWSAAKAYRRSKLAGGVTTPKGIVQSDSASRSFIDQMANSASRFKLNSQIVALGTVKVVNSATWSINFRMSDNSIITHTSDDMIAMADAVTAFDKASQVASDAIRTAIFAATTSAAVAAIDITLGYPS